MAGDLANTTTGAGEESTVSVLVTTSGCDGSETAAYGNVSSDPNPRGPSSTPAPSPASSSPSFWQSVSSQNPDSIPQRQYHKDLVLTSTDLALALTRDILRHEVHVLFIMVVVGLTLFFCHSLIRLFMLATQPQEKTPVIPTIGTTENFRPVEPIRVHVVHDIDLDVERNGNLDDDWDDEDLHDDRDIEKKVISPVAPPPPVYGQWRGSVRADPNLLHWARVEPGPQVAVAHPSPKNGDGEGIASQSASTVNDSETAVERPQSRSSAGEPQQALGARPPSYISEDGVSYVVDGVPRSTAGVSDIHPAWRSPPAVVRSPKYVPSPAYAPSAITEWPGPQRI